MGQRWKWCRLRWHEWRYNYAWTDGYHHRDVCSCSHDGYYHQDVCSCSHDGYYHQNVCSCSHDGYYHQDIRL